MLGHSIMNDNFIPKLPEISKCQDFHYLFNMAEKKPLWLYSIIRPLIPVVQLCHHTGVEFTSPLNQISFYNCSKYIFIYRELTVNSD